MPKRGDISRLRRAAKDGDVYAAADLGNIFLDADDLVAAEHWHRLSAAACDYGALCLGRLLCVKGERGHTGCMGEGVEWLKKAAISQDPRMSDELPRVAGALGLALFKMKDLDEAEHWLTTAISGGHEPSRSILDELQGSRADFRTYRMAAPQAKEPRRPSADSSQVLDVSGVTFYDGRGHNLGPSQCTVTKTRLIIDDARGGIRQIPLSAITSVSTPGRMVSPKMLRVSAPGVAYDIYCHSKDEKDLLAAWLSKRIREA